MDKFWILLCIFVGLLSASLGFIAGRYSVKLCTQILKKKETSLVEKEKGLEEREDEVKRIRAKVVIRENKVYKREVAVEEREKQLDNEVETRVINQIPGAKELYEVEKKALENFAKEIELALVEKIPNLLEGIKLGRLHNSFEPNKEFSLKNLNFTAEVHTASNGKENRYTTTLKSCTCPDFTRNKTAACKHMLFLARSLGILQVYRELHKEEFEDRIKADAEWKFKK